MSYYIIFILFVYVDAVRSQCNGNHMTLEADGVNRYLQSPNYGNEYGNRTLDCAWIINLPSGKHFAILHFEDLRLHYRDEHNHTHCMTSYDLRINEEKFGCDPGQFVPSERNEFCIDFQTPTCAQHNICVKKRKMVDKVHISFSSSGERVKPGMTPIVNGFRIRYAVFSCPEIRPNGKPPTTVSSSSSTSISTDKATTTAMTTTKVKTNTIKAIPTSSKSSGISSARTDSSNEMSIAFSNASNITRESSQTTYTTSPTANKNQGEDDSNTKLSFTIDLHWIILVSAIAGGLLLILAVVVCCKIQRKKKTTVDDEEIEAGDADPTSDKTEPPVYSMAEDGPSNQKSSQEQEATNQNATQLDSNTEDKLVVENVAYVTSQESPITSVSQPGSTLSESIQNDEDKATIIDEPGDEFYSVVRLKSNKEKTTVRYLKESNTHIDAP